MRTFHAYCSMNEKITRIEVLCRIFHSQKFDKLQFCKYRHIWCFIRLRSFWLENTSTFKTIVVTFGSNRMKVVLILSIFGGGGTIPAKIKLTITVLPIPTYHFFIFFESRIWFKTMFCSNKSSDQVKNLLDP